MYMPHLCDGKPSRWFREVSGKDFEKVVDSIRTVFFCGGVTFLAVNQPRHTQQPALKLCGPHMLAWNLRRNAAHRY